MALEALAVITAAEAEAALAKCAQLGPDSAADLARAGVPVRVTMDGGSGVMVLQRVGDGLWVAAAQGPTIHESFAVHGLPLVEAIARRIGCKRVGFMTRRPGLARRAIAQGWRCELTKELQP